MAHQAPWQATIHLGSHPYHMVCPMTQEEDS